MPAGRDCHCIAHVLGTILRTIHCVYLPLSDGNPPFAERKASQSEQSLILYPMKPVGCAFSTVRRWWPCWMVAQLGQPVNYSICSEMYEVSAVKMMCDADATPRVVHCPHREYLISSQGLPFMRCLVVLQEEAWAVFCMLTNNTPKLNQELAATREYISLLPAYTFFLFSTHFIYTESILILTSHDLHKTTPYVSKHAR